MVVCLHFEFVFMLMSFNWLTDDLMKDNPPSKFGWSIFAAQICLFCEKYENPRNLGIVRACADKSHLCLNDFFQYCWLLLLILYRIAFRIACVSTKIYPVQYDHRFKKKTNCFDDHEKIYKQKILLIITGVQASGVMIDRLLRQCCFVWSETVGPHSSGNFKD